jgi:hypothetical protein
LDRQDGLGVCVGVGVGVGVGLGLGVGVFVDPVHRIEFGLGLSTVESIFHADVEVGDGLTMGSGVKQWLNRDIPYYPRMDDTGER